MGSGHHLALLALVGATGGALNIQVGKSPIITNGWDEYTSAITRYPQCCSESNCGMVRISPDVIKAVQKSGLNRVQLHDSSGKIVEAFVTYDAKTDGLFGKIYRDDGTIQTLAPSETSDTEMDAKCKSPFHKLFSDSGKYKSVPVPLFSLYSAPQIDSCCQEGASCYKISKNIDDGALKRNYEGNFPDLYIPRFNYPNVEAEVFSLKLKEPDNCKGQLCDVYMYFNEKKERLDIAKTAAGLSITINNGEVVSSEVVSCSKSSKSWQTKSLGKSLDATSLSPGMGRVAPGESCWDMNSYCNPLVYSEYYTILERGGKSDAELTLECYNIYQTAGLNNPDIKHFTIHFTRGEPECYLLSGCDRIFDDVCIGLDKCISGPIPCGPLPPTAECDVPPESGRGFLKWQCANVFGERLGPFEEGGKLPTFTTCLQACNSWKTTSGILGYLHSTCQRDGTWSSPAVLPPGATLIYPPAPWPKPDDLPPLTCGCPTLSLIYNGVAYNPNREDGADFVCEQQPAIGDHGEMLIQTGNQCYLYCDEVLALSTKCVSDAWTGEPDKGFWCFSEPNNRPMGVPDFRMHELLGVFYVQLDSSPQQFRCGRVQYRAAYGALGIVADSITPDDQVASFQGLAKKADPNMPGNPGLLYYVDMLDFDENILNVVFPPNYFVLATDYSSYVVIYYLGLDELLDEVNLVVYTRAQHPSQALMDQIREELSYSWVQGFVDLPSLFEHSQNNCGLLPPLN